MPEYLTPGVYLEETSFRSRSIEGVPTSTFGMAGLTRYGPVPYQLDAPEGHHGATSRCWSPASPSSSAPSAGWTTSAPATTPELPGLRGPGVLRQRRPAALRLPGVPVHQTTPAPSVIDIDANFAKLAAGRRSGRGDAGGRGGRGAGRADDQRPGRLPAQQEHARRRRRTPVTLKGVLARRRGRDRRRRPRPSYAEGPTADAGEHAHRRCRRRTGRLGCRKDGGGTDPVPPTTARPPCATSRCRRHGRGWAIPRRHLHRA